MWGDTPTCKETQVCVPQKYKSPHSCPCHICQELRPNTCHAPFVSRSGSESLSCPQNPPPGPPPELLPGPCSSSFLPAWSSGLSWGLFFTYLPRLAKLPRPTDAGHPPMSVPKAHVTVNFTCLGKFLSALTEVFSSIYSLTIISLVNSGA